MSLRPLIFILATLLSPKIAFALTVCGITVNSDNEFNAFKRAMGPGIEAIELLQIKEVNGRVRFDSDEWIEATCRKQIKCDVIVLSGHFGGTFGHETLPILIGLPELEKASCSNRCPGIFQQAKEVYLLGCYATAGKDSTGFNLSRLDVPTRQPKDIPLTTQIKYTNLERMRRIFPNTPRIYGYPGVGPLGQQVEQSFYSSILQQKDYFHQLTTIPDQKLLTRNRSKIGQLDQVSGSNFDPELKAEAKQICQSNFGQSLQERINAGVDLVMQPNGIKHLHNLMNILKSENVTSLNSYLNRAKAQSLTTRLNEWKTDRAPIATHLQTLELEKKLGLRREDEINKDMRDFILSFVDQPNVPTQVGPAVCLAAETVPSLQTLLRAQDFKTLNDSFALWIVDCIQPLDPEFIPMLQKVQQAPQEPYFGAAAERIIRGLRSAR